ncbi:ATP-binding protein [Peptostreptococcus porci]|uniref:ATP-binding protein n=1 Tax=Peptostreptococcus porci TaxID=2652282 RepID=UPI002A7EBF1B|nr:ATP-binding protein [Peptostreptococcus porci]MDY4127493.1 ATP-binding protein [Peptostreptococcus porci]MDY5437409.1 ATP-binding protein [Peptostreptococcus porci]MDY5964017.1 ATP-binding protein [Peptostreptococcus porci]
MIKRVDYLNSLEKWRDEKVIKIVTGMRRCGKSTLLLQFQNRLVETGIETTQIISLNFEKLEYEDLQDYKKLYSYLKDRLISDKKNYIFLDEVQRVKYFEKVVDSLYVMDNVDIYITGSNSQMLSSELATFLSGRYVEIKMLPLSFKEFFSIGDLSIDDSFVEYMRYGGLPYVTTMEKDSDKVEMYLEGIYNTVLVKDIEDRQNRKNLGMRAITDISLLKSISKYLSSVVGNMVTVKYITNYLLSGGRKVSPNTVSDYIEALCDSFIFYEVDRFDIVGKTLLKNNKKYYIVDLGLRNYILPRKNYDLGFGLENIVYFELLRRGYRVNVGKLKDKEIDFVTRKNDELHYIQVTASMVDENTFEREMRPLREIRDNYEKTVLTLDRFSVGNYDGIKVVNIVDWLLE